MAADSMEIDDSLYRQVCFAGTLSPAAAFLSKAVKWSFQVLFVFALFPITHTLISPSLCFSSVQPPAICPGWQCHAPDGTVLSLSQRDGGSWNWDRYAKFENVFLHPCNVSHVVFIVCRCQVWPWTTHFCFYSKEYRSRRCKGMQTQHYVSWS